MRFGSWIAASSERASRGRQVLLGVERWLFRQRSPYQEVVIAEVPGYGRGLFLDGVVQFLEVDEFIYHEHLALPPLLYHAHPRNVLIAGGGDGLALREVLRDPRVECAVLVEIDETVIRACREHLSDLQRGALDDPRVEVVVGDAREALAALPESLDVALVDLTDAYGERGVALYREVISRTAGILRPGAVLCVHGDAGEPGVPVAAVYRLLEDVFTHVELYRACVNSFAGDWGFVIASDAVDFAAVPTEELRARAALLKGELRALVTDRFPSAFVLPAYLREVLERARQGKLPPPEEHEVYWIYPDGPPASPEGP